MCMDARQILNDYIDACELIRETEEDILLTIRIPKRRQKRA